MKAAEQLDPNAILDALGVRNFGTPQAVSGGQDTLIWRVEHDGQTSALRVFRPEQLSVCRREVAAMTLARAANLPVPDVCAEGIWENRPALLLSWRAGKTLLDALKKSPLSAPRLFQRFGETQARLHNVAVPLGAFPDWIGLAGPNEAALQTHFHRLPARHQLLHGDFHPMNVLTDGRQITAVLDWANVLCGDPRADLARTVVLLRLSHDDTGLPPIFVRFLRALAVANWTRGGRQAGGNFDNMAAFYAWAGAATLEDLKDKDGRPGLDAQRARLRRWTETWKRRAGIMDT